MKDGKKKRTWRETEKIKDRIYDIICLDFVSEKYYYYYYRGMFKHGTLSFKQIVSSLREL